MRWSLFGPPAEAGPSSSPLLKTPRTSAVHRPPEPLGWQATLDDELRLQEKIWPTTDDLPGCMSLIDDFLRCYALLPAMRGWYRYGYVRSCSEKWDKYKYCLSIKGEKPEERRRLWIQRLSEDWTKMRIQGSSEDVWEVRKEPPADFPPARPVELDGDAEILS